MLGSEVSDDRGGFDIEATQKRRGDDDTGQAHPRSAPLSRYVALVSVAVVDAAREPPRMEARLLEKLKAIEALHAGAMIDGERAAASARTKPCRYRRQRRTTLNVQAPESFVNKTLWPEFIAINDDLKTHRRQHNTHHQDGDPRRHRRR